MRFSIRHWLFGTASLFATVWVVGLSGSALYADDAAGMGGPVGKWPVLIAPTTQPVGPMEPIVMRGWKYSSRKSASPRDGVPWELLCEPVGEDATTWSKGDILAGLRNNPGPTNPFIEASRSFVRKQQQQPDDPAAIPISIIPTIVWGGKMSAELQDVVGIHFHEYVSNDVARVLYTLHKVPPNGPDGEPLKNYPGKKGTRVEATLVTPVTFSLDQSIVVREDPMQTDRTPGRVDHEAGHARVSQEVLLAVLLGPQDWNPGACTGRRASVEYYWKRERISRPWDGWKGFEGGGGKLITLRTTVALVPPTRWSMLLPIPPERVTPQHLQQFNDALVLLGDTFAATDRAAQDRFHSHHGSFEAAAP